MKIYIGQSMTLLERISEKLSQQYQIRIQIKTINSHLQQKATVLPAKEILALNQNKRSDMLADLALTDQIDALRTPDFGMLDWDRLIEQHKAEQEKNRSLIQRECTKVHFLFTPGRVVQLFAVPPNDFLHCLTIDVEKSPMQLSPVDWDAITRWHAATRCHIEENLAAGPDDEEDEEELPWAAKDDQFGTNTFTDMELGVFSRKINDAEATAIKNAYVHPPEVHPVSVEIKFADDALSEPVDMYSRIHPVKWHRYSPRSVAEVKYVYERTQARVNDLLKGHGALGKILVGVGGAGTVTWINSSLGWARFSHKLNEAIGIHLNSQILIGVDKTKQGADATDYYGDDENYLMNPPARIPRLNFYAPPDDALSERLPTKKYEHTKQGADATAIKNYYGDDENYLMNPPARMRLNHNHITCSAEETMTIKHDNTPKGVAIFVGGVEIKGQQWAGDEDGAIGLSAKEPDLTNVYREGFNKLLAAYNEMALKLTAAEKKAEDADAEAARKYSIAFAIKK